MGTISTILMSTFLSCQHTEVSVTEYTPLLGQWNEFDNKVNQIEDTISKDVLLLRLAIQQPMYSEPLCSRVVSNNAKQKCRLVLNHPYHRSRD